MLWPVSLKSFVEQLYVLKVNDDGITPMEKFSGSTKDIALKIATHGYIQSMSWIQGYNSIYLYYPSGNPDHAQVSILDT